MTQPTPADKAPCLDPLCDSLRAFVLEAAAGPCSFHDFERGVWTRLLRLGHAATAEFLRLQGSGDLGDCFRLDDGQSLRRLAAPHDRSFTCLFGTFSLSRVCYGSREGQKIDFVPLDDRLDLPAGKFSYLLQDFNNLLAGEQPFAAVAAALERILGLKQHVDSLERGSRHAAESVGPFRDQRPAPPAEQEGPILVRTADAKGVVMRRDKDAPPAQRHDHKTGPKPGRKKQAILGCVYSVSPVVRTAQGVVDSLFGEAESDAARPPRPQIRHKQVIALLNEYSDGEGKGHDGMAEAFAWMDSQLDERDPFMDKVIVNVMDGDERLRKQKQSSGEPGGVDVLDLLHVMERVWEMAGLLHARESRGCEEQVKAWLLKILRGQVKAVARDARAKGAGLGAAACKELHRACAYLEGNAQRMRYHEYLRAGYPIASGVIEGACRHYVKDRMERAGMSWSQQGAQAMLALRAVALNGDWDEFQVFYRQEQSRALHPHRSLLDGVVWPAAA
jgi:hypothetical protein